MKESKNNKFQEILKVSNLKFTKILNIYQSKKSDNNLKKKLKK